MYCRCARRITGFAVGVHGGHELEQLEGVAERAVGQDAVDGRAGERPVDRSGEAVALRPSRYIGGVNSITIIIILLIIIGGAHERTICVRAMRCVGVRGVEWRGMAWHEHLEVFPVRERALLDAAGALGVVGVAIPEEGRAVSAEAAAAA